ncbi:hypothetical protein HLB25_07545 [Dickeya dadantii]|uniref:hypothetical protein n=1 Tax=Dickeya dadantii TaxID=204038 RepID=UPI0002E9F303|nr:hypothetical protein [Dickeya dadantii]NPE56324.1 hypothetical protein [Dickeya dadantii]NPE66631.1 hypothetical protein [Dickeya dadantii]
MGDRTVGNRSTDRQSAGNQGRADGSNASAFSQATALSASAWPIAGVIQTG